MGYKIACLLKFIGCGNGDFILNTDHTVPGIHDTTLISHIWWKSLSLFNTTKKEAGPPPQWLIWLNWMHLPDCRTVLTVSEKQSLWGCLLIQVVGKRSDLNSVFLPLLSVFRSSYFSLVLLTQFCVLTILLSPCLLLTDSCFFSFSSYSPHPSFPSSTRTHAHLTRRAHKWPIADCRF